MDRGRGSGIGDRDGDGDGKECCGNSPDRDTDLNDSRNVIRRALIAPGKMLEVVGTLRGREYP